MDVVVVLGGGTACGRGGGGAGGTSTEREAVGGAATGGGAEGATGRGATGVGRTAVIALALVIRGGGGRTPVLGVGMGRGGVVPELGMRGGSGVPIRGMPPAVVRTGDWTPDVRVDAGAAGVAPEVAFTPGCWALGFQPQFAHWAPSKTAEQRSQMVTGEAPDASVRKLASGSHAALIPLQPVRRFVAARRWLDSLFGSGIPFLRNFTCMVPGC